MAPAEPARFGPLYLASGVRPGNVLTYLYAAFAGVALTSFVSVIMPYILNVNVRVPASEQGQVAGDLVFYGELVLIGLSGVIGAWSDQYGRRAVLIVGLLLLGAGYVALGYVSNLPQLVAARVFATIGIATVSVMITTIQVDYPAERSRGQLVGFVGIAIGVGAIMIGVLFTRLPDFYAAAGYTELAASRLTMLSMTAFCVVTALIVRAGLIGGPPPHVTRKQTVRVLVAQGYAAARSNPLLLLAYACAFVGRADLVVVGTFYSLWLTQAGIASGLAADDAARAAGGMFAVVMSAALVWAPAMGWLNDRLDRTLVMAIALLLAMLGYCTMGLLGDVPGAWLYPASILLGVGQMSVTLGEQHAGRAGITAGFSRARWSVRFRFAAQPVFCSSRVSAVASTTAWRQPHPSC